MKYRIKVRAEVVRTEEFEIDDDLLSGLDDDEVAEHVNQVCDDVIADLEFDIGGSGDIVQFDVLEQVAL